VCCQFDACVMLISYVIKDAARSANDFARAQNSLHSNHKMPSGRHPQAKKKLILSRDTLDCSSMKLIYTKKRHSRAFEQETQGNFGEANADIRHSANCPLNGYEHECVQEKSQFQYESNLSRWQRWLAIPLSKM
jgi:hypothetical protein